MGFEQLAQLKEQLSKQSKSAPAKKPSRPPRPATDAQQRPVDPVVHAIGKLQRRFPVAFPKNPAPKVPLKVGVIDDLLQRASDIGLTDAEIRNAIKVWCRGARYWSSLVEGAARVDLDGNPTGNVSAADAGRARQLEARRSARASTTSGDSAQKS
ncbi:MULTISPECIES: ProQ/FinO family protein [unclassified Caballeronia]|uniref:ProQ/FinO family protein n=1 Tax=unclassified Caballeronia TaxID=2646786 RepID=UPI00286243C2|nr:MULTISPECIES: ProQ/FinO family protein [unclassified Caballeronia]MDR5741112.1 ProQ/FinO family protein [Caballeronia sp. LZ016]MDR5807012.1 ProQ/FinO family protein [Caballeronia sp. LZ019]